MFDVIVEQQPTVPIARREVEFVERKGIGHPDSICDAVMESISLALCRTYLQVAGRVLHHNTDKGLLVAGQTTPRLGGGTVQAPMRLVVGDRATRIVNGTPLLIDEIVESAALNWFQRSLRYVDPRKHLVIQNELGPGSTELMSIFDERGPNEYPANDTSVAVGFAPLTETENIVLFAERFLNSGDLKQQFPETGEDVKIMVARRGRKLQITAAVAFVDRQISNEAAYFDRKDALKNELARFLQSKIHTLDSVEIQINTLDRRGCGEKGMYLTVLGTSAEGADGGEVGRGNRVNGIISLCRPITMEAAAGKNPVSHVGKIYNVLAHQIAAKIHQSIEGVDEAYVWLCSRIGSPISQPWMAAVQLALANGARIGDVSPSIQSIVRQELAEVGVFVDRMSRGEFAVC